ncbi:MAG: BolA family transcriptional regulator [Sphingomonadaceae bacterium]|nr:BolA family transcriptional regulator [Sphingomonadaceae bacterium]
MGERAAEIERRLTAALAPTRLEVIDDSDDHLGHAGHTGAGESHFTVRIAAAAFAGLSRVDQQRRVYAALGDLMNAGGIHALVIEASAA